MEKTISFPLILCLLMFTFADYITSSDISPTLQDKMAPLDNNDFIRVVIKPVPDQNQPSLKVTIRNLKTRSLRHRAAMQHLQESAENSQQRLRDLLENRKLAGQAQNLKYFWLTNLIEGELTVTTIRQLATAPDIDVIELYPEIEPPDIIDTPKSSKTYAGLEPNLSVVNAPAAWVQGYDGNGRLVCNFDTGVEGDHPALFDNYRGNKGYPASLCWFSPTDSSTFPHSFSIPHYPATESHGTHTMGIMVGHDDITGDTVGVAPGADWIAAVAFDVAGSSIFEAFQWAADPDGDPNTISDVPDVINHSWGLTSIGCDDIFWELIDNTEALGIVNIFSAGNGGPLDTSISNPANRATDSITNFAVGAINHTDSNLYFASSKGPSDCDDESIKPNLVAPGRNINSSIPGSTYTLRSGTSMAAPHVAGAVAILRQKNPDATVDEIKTALLTSTYDLGAPGADNEFGWGLLDIAAALDKITAISEPSLEISKTTYPVILPGDSIGVSVELHNNGLIAANITAQFSNPDPELTVFTTQLNFGDIDQDSRATGDTTLDLNFAMSLIEGEFVGLDIDIYIDGIHHSQKRLSFLIGERGGRNYYNHDNGRLRFTISNYGTYGFGGDNLIRSTFGSYIPLDFYGFQLDRVMNDLYEASFIIGFDSAHVSDNAQNYIMEADNDFRTITGGAIAVSDPGDSTDVETSSLFNDSWAENPLGVLIKQNSYAWNSSPNNNFIILEFIITNNSGLTLNGLHAGLYLDWNINDYSENRCDFLAGLELAFMYWSDGFGSSDYRGVQILEPTDMSNNFAFAASETQNGAFDEGTKFKGLSDFSRPSFVIYSTDISHLTSVGPFNLANGESTKIAFAVLGDGSLTLLQDAALQAKLKYSEILTGVDETTDLPLPDRLVLEQNYPNPFNAATTIVFALPRSGHIKISIFNILGERVKTLVNDNYFAGQHKVIWDGVDERNKPVATGIYFYQIIFDEITITKNMLLLK